MGRGLSGIQKRILAYAYREQGFDDPDPNGPPPHPVRTSEARWSGSYARHIIPGKAYSEWTPSERVSVSRALTRLERRGMITRNPFTYDPIAKNRTQSISLTEYGRMSHQYEVVRPERKPRVSAVRVLRELRLVQPEE